LSRRRAKSWESVARLRFVIFHRSSFSSKCSLECFTLRRGYPREYPTCAARRSTLLAWSTLLGAEGTQRRTLNIVSRGSWGGARRDYLSAYACLSFASVSLAMGQRKAPYPIDIRRAGADTTAIGIQPTGRTVRKFQGGGWNGNRFRVAGADTGDYEICNISGLNKISFFIHLPGVFLGT
jgi:hypothetical protein